MQNEKEKNDAVLLVVIPSLPGSRLQFFMAMQVQHYCTSLATQQWLDFVSECDCHLEVTRGTTTEPQLVAREEYDGVVCNG